MGREIRKVPGGRNFERRKKKKNLFPEALLETTLTDKKIADQNWGENYKNKGKKEVKS